VRENPRWLSVETHAHFSKLVRLLDVFEHELEHEHRGEAFCRELATPH
jgi:hypothetical protein